MSGRGKLAGRRIDGFLGKALGGGRGGWIEGEEKRRTLRRGGNRETSGSRMKSSSGKLTKQRGGGNQANGSKANRGRKNFEEQRGVCMGGRWVLGRKLTFGAKGGR